MSTRPLENGTHSTLKELLFAKFEWFEEQIQDTKAPEQVLLTRAEARLMEHIRHSSPSISDIAHSFGISRQAVHKKVTELSTSGYVTLNDDDRNKRIKRVVLTDSGRQLLDANRSMAEQVESRLLSQLGPDKVHQLKNLLSESWQ